MVHTTSSLFHTLCPLAWETRKWNNIKEMANRSPFNFDVGIKSKQPFWRVFYSTYHTVFFPLLGQNHLLSSASKNISCRQAFSIGSKFLTETEKGEKRSLLFASTYQVRIVPKINFLSISVFLHIPNWKGSKNKSNEGQKNPKFFYSCWRFFPLLHFPLKALFVWFSDKYILCVSPLFARPNRFVLCAVNSDVFMVVTDPYYSTALAACLSRRVVAAKTT